MNYKEDLEMDNIEFELNLRELPIRTKEFRDSFPNFEGELTQYSDEENITIDKFKQENEVLYGRIKDELQVDFALMTLHRRVEIEIYKHLKLSCAKDYYDNEDTLTICSDKDLINLSEILKRVLLK